MKIKEHGSKFIKVRCQKCKNEQIAFGKVSMEVKCLVCGQVMAKPTGGRSVFEGSILEVLE